DKALRLLATPAGKAAAYTHGVQLDVADCFDTVDHALLRTALAARVADPSALRLLDRVLDSGADSAGWLWWRRRRGLSQGSSLSPLLCNLALHALDLALDDLGRSCDGGVCLLRYADDLLLLARDGRLAARGLALVRQVLTRLHQQLRNPAAVPHP